MKFIPLKALILLLVPAVAWAQVNSNDQPSIQKESKYQPLVDTATKSNSDALIVIEEGEKVINYHKESQNELIESMSVTKSIVALTVAQLLTDNKIDSLNTPVAHYYPEWKQGQKEDITIRHLMNHTSGLQNKGNTVAEIQPSPDFIQLALCASVVDKPGSNFSYNNKAVNLLSGIIRKAADQPMDAYLQNTIFDKLNISEFDWRTDNAGNLRAMAGLQVRADDLAKLGQLVLQKGSWKGEQLIKERWIDELLAQGQPHTKESGLLWWRVPSDSKYVIDDEHLQKMAKAGFKESVLAKVRKAKGHYDHQGAVQQTLMKLFNKKELRVLKQEMQKHQMNPWKSESGSIVGYKAEGYLGQYLVVYPEQKVVAVRMIKNSEDYNSKTDMFGNFSQMVYKLATASD